MESLKEPGSLGIVLEERAKKNKDKVFLQFEDEKITYEEMNERANRVANGFFDLLGIKKGDRVAVMMANCPEWLYVWFGMMKMGAVLIPVNVALKGEGLSYILDHSEAETVILDHDFLDRLDFVQREMKVERLKRTIVNTRGAPEDFKLPTGAKSLQELLEKSSSHTPQVEINPTDLSEISYTSGTTGPPKGVLVPQSAFLTTGIGMSLLLGYTPDDVLYTCLPCFHANFQQLTVSPALYADATVALDKRFSVSRFWDQIRKYNATEFNYIGGMLPFLCSRPERPDDLDNPVRIAFGGGCPKEIWEEVERRFGLKIAEGYAAVDGGGIFNIFDGKVGSIGKPTPFVDIKVVDENENQCPPYKVGELLSRPHPDIGVNLVKYYKDPERTREATKGGWWHSGDLAYYDEDGYFFFVGRKKESLRRRGENISPWEIESVVNKHPKVIESAVVGVPSELGVGEDDVKIYVVLEPGEKIRPEEVLDYCQERMAYYLVPRYVEFAEELPRTPTFRIEYYKLKEKGVTEETWDREKAGYKVKR